MKRTLLIFSALAAIISIAASAWLFRLNMVTSRVEFVFIGYTNDAPGVRRPYAVRNPSERSTALFQLSNRTRHRIGYWRSEIQVRQKGGWVNEPSWHSTGSLVMEVESGKTALVDFPVPEGANVWRCSLGLMGPQKTFFVWSPEVRQ